jgi:hypothetical protein
LPACWTIARLTRHLAGLEAGREYAGVEQDENKALVRRYYQEVLTGHDSDLLARLLDPCFVSHGSGGPDAGTRAYAAAVDATHAALPDLRMNSRISGPNSWPGTSTGNPGG